VRSTFTEIGPSVDREDRSVVDLTGSVDVDEYLAGLWAE
jgi:hypothetical protein